MEGSLNLTNVLGPADMMHVHHMARGCSCRAAGFYAAAPPICFSRSSGMDKRKDVPSSTLLSTARSPR